MNITHTEKDEVLSYLVNYETVMPESLSCIDLVDMQSSTGYTCRFINSILMGFKQEGLISDLNLRCACPSFHVIVHQQAFDMFNRGGFTMKEDLLKKEVEKLLLEIELLKPTLGDKIEQFTTIANNIMSMISPFKIT